VFYGNNERVKRRMSEGISVASLRNALNLICCICVFFLACSSEDFDGVEGVGFSVILSECLLNLWILDLESSLLIDDYS